MLGKKENIDEVPFVFISGEELQGKILIAKCLNFVRSSIFFEFPYVYQLYVICIVCDMESQKGGNEN